MMSLCDLYEILSDFILVMTMPDARGDEEQ